MATAQEHTVSVKLLVHKNQNKVIFAEADNHFADILFSFLTLPLGTAIRLVGGGQSNSQSGPKVGSLTNLYQSVSDLDLKFFSTEMCKTMLLYPRSNAEAECQRLKVNIDDTEPTKYFICPNDDDSCTRDISTHNNVRCRCGRLINLSIPFKEFGNRNNEGAIFFEEATMLIIGDDFSIMPSSPKAIMELLNRFGITDVEGLTEKVVHVGMKEILELLKYSLVSKTPLTDAFLRTGHQTPQVKCEHSTIITSNDNHDTNNSQKFPLELLIRKSDNKILFAEANEAFINQIFSFLTFPLGLVVCLLGGKSSCGSIDQLYSSVINEKLGRYIISPENSKLLHPKLPLHFCCEAQVLPIPVADDDRSTQFCRLRPDSTSSIYYLYKYHDVPITLPHYRIKCISNPKFPNGGRNKGGYFIKSPAAFVITDDLYVKPASSVVSVTFLKQLNISKTNVEQKVVEFGIHEVYKLLNYSLISESALTQTLMALLKTPKQEK